MNTVPIAFAFDNNLILPACICISSLMMNAQKTTFYDIFILHSSEEDLSKDMLNQIPTFYPNCRIQYRQVGKDFERAFEIRDITTATYYRLAISELIPEYSKIIYADTDIIFRMDLNQLYQMDVSSYYLAATLDLSMILSTEGTNYAKEILGKDYHQYLQAGLLLLNLEQMRSVELIKYFKKELVNKYKFQDQDILNITCQGNVIFLPPFYNATNYFYYYLQKENDKLLCLYNKEDIANTIKRGNIHYNGQKPWKGYCVNFDIWWEYYRKSPFFDQKYYFDFFNNKLNELDKLSLWKRIKILIRWFVIGKK